VPPHASAGALPETSPTSRGGGDRGTLTADSRLGSVRIRRYPPPRLPLVHYTCILNGRFRNSGAALLKSNVWDGERNTKRRFLLGHLSRHLVDYQPQTRNTGCNLQISIPANSAWKLSTAPVTLKRQIWPARPAKKTQGGNIARTSGIRPLPNPFHGALCSQAGTQGGHITVFGFCRRRPGAFNSRGHIQAGNIGRQRQLRSGGGHIARSNWGA